MAVYRSILFCIMLANSTLILGIQAIVTVLVTGLADVAHLYGRLWSELNLWAAGVRVEVTGLENIDRRQSYIFAANHQSGFDIFAIYKLPVQFRWLAKQELFRVPVLGQAMAAIGYIPIDRSDRRKAFRSINLAARRVREGTSIVIFPEGTRSSDGVLQEFKKGGFMLAIKSQRPIVPISLSGSHKILAKGGCAVHPGVIRMTIGEPIPTAGLTSAARNRLIREVRQAIARHLAPGERRPEDEQVPVHQPNETLRG